MFKKIQYKISLAIAVFAVMNLFAISAVSAEDPTDPNAKDLIVIFNPDDPSSDKLFNTDNFLPGESVVGLVYVENNSVEEKRIAVQAINVIDTDGFSNALNIEIKENGVTVYNKSPLSTFFNTGEVFLSDLDNNNTTTTYEFIVDFYYGANNNFQGKTLNFDVLIGFQGEDGGISPGAGSGSGGFLPPGMTIKNECEKKVSTTTATIIWFTNYKATSRVLYSDKEDILDLTDNSGTLPKYGYASTTEEFNTPANENGKTYHEVEIINLTPETIYYFRCISHASPDSISREHSFTTLALAEIKQINGSKETKNDDDIEKYDDIKKETEKKESKNNKQYDNENIIKVNVESENKKIGQKQDNKETVFKKIAKTVDNIVGAILGEKETDKNVSNNILNTDNSIDDKRGLPDSNGKWFFIFIIILFLILVFFILYKKDAKKGKEKTD